jgi:hypothetical protein
LKRAAVLRLAPTVQDVVRDRRLTH